jgi:hypothetical protein
MILILLKGHFQFLQLGLTEKKCFGQVLDLFLKLAGLLLVLK